MTRLTVPALAKMAKTASGDPAALTLATHPTSGDRYAAWSYGCILLPTATSQQLAATDGRYTITTKGALTPAEREGFSAALVVQRMLPILDLPREHQAMPNGWEHTVGEFRRVYLVTPDCSLAVMDDLWQAWRTYATGLTWAIRSPAGTAITWALDETARATALLLTVHPRTVPTPPDWTPEGPTE
ncbi:hypothetical protein GCM10009555_018070 [Acrocarpospora macrocephala]|uniref:Uncharacterized protein n=1 Tax=Acrocarpospora macrocephala TaxID=150177 RepID=A0A5M3WEH3_9ACTN|nr:hypothetical protein [Acrocarpospora macrocephala]GES07467.1 hypothetical protein Amac_010620 [Acrocarpospora macrocephala]